MTSPFSASRFAVSRLSVSQLAVPLFALAACTGDKTPEPAQTPVASSPTASPSVAAPTRPPVDTTAKTVAPPPATKRPPAGLPPGMISTKTGVYTRDQALEGQDIYAGMCKSCHAGLGNHSGPIFREHWGGQTLLELYYYVQYNMPKNNPNSISAEDNIKVIAYLLSLNGVPAGRTQLSADTLALAKILLDTTVVK